MTPKIGREITREEVHEVQELKFSIRIREVPLADQGGSKLKKKIRAAILIQTLNRT